MLPVIGAPSPALAEHAIVADSRPPDGGAREGDASLGRAMDQHHAQDGEAAMRLAIDAVGNRSGGGARVMLELLRAVEEHEGIDEAVVFTTPRERREVELEGLRKVRQSPQRAADRIALRPVWHLHQLEREALQEGADMVLCLNGMGWGRRLPFTHLFQQALPFSPEGLACFPRRMRARFRVIGELTRFSLAHSRAIAVQAPWMRALVEQQIGVGGAPIEVFAPTLEFAAPCEAGASQARVPTANTLLYVGGDYPHKALDKLVEGFRLLRLEVPGARLLLTLAHTRRLAVPGVVFLGTVPHRDLPALYGSVSAVVMPSLVESAGLPLYEAMASGACVIAADRAYAWDACGDAAVYYEPTVPQNFVNVARRLLMDAALRRSVAERGVARCRGQASLASYGSLLEFVMRLGVRGAGP